MQARKAAELRKAWEAKGNPPCDHPSLDVEHDLGGGTGDYVCTVCGQSGWGREWAKKSPAPDSN